MKLNEVERIFRSQFLDNPPDAEVTKEVRFQNWDNHDEGDILMSLGDNADDGDWDRIMKRYIYPAMKEYARDILTEFKKDIVFLQKVKLNNVTESQEEEESSK